LPIECEDGQVRRRQLLLSLGGLGAAAAALTAWATNPGAKLPPEGELARIAVGLAFVTAAVLADLQFADAGVANLMAAVGLTWFLWDLAWIYFPVPYTVGAALGALFQPILAHLAIAFPTGQLRSRFDRRLVRTGYGAWLVLSFATLAVWDPQVDCPGGCAANLLLVYPDRALHDALESSSTLIGLTITAAVVGAVIWHWRTGSPPARRALAPVLWSSFPIAGILTAYTLLGRSQLPPLAPLLLLTLPIAFLIGLLRMRLTRAGVGRLVIELGQQPPPGRLRDALAAALRDSALQVAYWNRDRRTFVDANGSAVELPPPGASRQATILEGEAGPLAALVHDAALQEDPELVKAVATAARLAIENERLHAETRAQIAEVRASRERVVVASDMARRRLERDLHDGSQQHLVTVAVHLGLAQSRLRANPDPELAGLIGEAVSQLHIALAELRQLARGIHPPILMQSGLGPALESLAERSPLPVKILATPPRRLPSPIESTAYFVVAESLANAAKYARASAITVCAEQTEDRMRVEVVDDGVGGADLRGGSGLQGLADRVGALDGYFEIQSPAGGGTRVTALIPCRS